MRRLVVEDLPGDLARLRQDGAAHLRVGERADVGALVDEAFATGIDHDAVEEISRLKTAPSDSSFTSGAPKSQLAEWQRALAASS